MSNIYTPSGTPPADHPIDERLVRGLLEDQHPDLAGLPIRALSAGWDNTLFRLGDKLTMRLPRRHVAAQLIAHEQRWLPVLAPRLPLPIPVPVRVGVPGRGYPWPWSVQPWLMGDSADVHPPAPDQAMRFGTFLRALHTPAPADAPRNPVRGGPLAERAAVAEPRLARLAERTASITPQIRALWQDALAAPLDALPLWLHGDLHPGNVLVERGAISGVIDWGDIAAGDRATDLAAIWMLFASATERRTALDACGDLSPATLARARGWAIHFGAMLLETGLADNQRYARIGERTLSHVAAGE